ncbi:hypothetical protein MRB53_038869 [Persea americana]|nr:hypothetical protein MRB53_038869 [Persea americana]
MSFSTFPNIGPYVVSTVLVAMFPEMIELQISNVLLLQYAQLLLDDDCCWPDVLPREHLAKYEQTSAIAGSRALPCYHDDAACRNLAEQIRLYDHGSSTIYSSTDYGFYYDYGKTCFFMKSGLKECANRIFSKALDFVFLQSHQCHQICCEIYTSPSPSLQSIEEQGLRSKHELMERAVIAMLGGRSNKGQCNRGPIVKNLTLETLFKKRYLGKETAVASCFC